MHKYFELVNDKISSWKSKGLSNEKISSITTTFNNKFATNLIYHNARLRVKFNGDFLWQDKAIYNHGPLVNIYIVYRSTPAVKDSNVTLENCPFGADKLTKNADIDKYKYSGYGTGFD